MQIEVVANPGPSNKKGATYQPVGKSKPIGLCLKEVDMPKGSESDLTFSLSKRGWPIGKL